jgi:hypothetical protein
MLDIEGPTWNFTQSENRDSVSALRSAVQLGDLNVTVYCSIWPETFGPDFNPFKDVPLIYAARLSNPPFHSYSTLQLLMIFVDVLQHHDLVPSHYDYVERRFGGWSVRLICSIDAVFRQW